jgi:3-deoxy-D-manno-octulosonic-acid transferase
VYLLYDAILFLAALFLVPYYLLRGATRGKVRRGLGQRLGLFAPAQLQVLRGREVIWIHAVSVGETRAAIPLIKALHKTYPDYALLLTNVTETGHDIARDLAELDLCLFFPFDFSFVIRRVLTKIDPRLIVIVETEIWPNLIRFARQRNIPVVLVNGRISDRSFPRYMFGRYLLRPILQQFNALGMQTELDAERIRAMGALPEQVVVTGNLKFDLQASLPGKDELDQLRVDFCIDEQIPVWVAGSTHAGEEQIIVDTYQRLIDQGRRLVLVLVPRHPERCKSVAEMLQAKGLPMVMRSVIDQRSELLRPGEILLVDTVGEMLKLYALSDIVFVGGSLRNVGGHNILEGCLLKKPVLFGPHMHNFKEISRLVLDAGGGMMVDDADDLHNAMERLLDRPQERTAMGKKGYGLLSRNAGATDRTLELIRTAQG